jgi:hypothetical protein|tara:strand:+ start:36 stop:407 length:372 start_codon:yes stop_codon:yes gene_type:complete
MSRVKDTYWHSLAHLCISAGLKPAEVARVIKNSFPKTEVNGRHVGAYKRRLINEGVVEKDTPKTGSEHDLIQMSHEIVTSEDMFVYNCSVGSKVRSLKCFEYKMTEATKDIVDDCDEWIAKIR